jgi:hypothetical protein
MFRGCLRSRRIPLNDLQHCGISLSASWERMLIIELDTCQVKYLKKNLRISRTRNGAEIFLFEFARWRSRARRNLPPMPLSGPSYPRSMEDYPQYATALPLQEASAEQRSSWQLLIKGQYWCHRNHRVVDTKSASPARLPLLVLPDWGEADPALLLSLPLM